MPFWLFLAVNKVFFVLFQKYCTNQKNVCVSIVLKAKTEKKFWKNVLTPKKGVFEFWNKNCKKCSSFFSFVLALKTIDAQIFISIFENTQKNVISNQKQTKCRFWQSITFFVGFQKYQPKEHLCVHCF